MKFSDLELKILRAIWGLGDGATVQEILDHWQEKDIPKYTTVLKTLQIMQEKKIIRADKAGRAYRYVPLVKKEEASKNTIATVIRNFFNNDKLALAQAFLGDNEFKKEELEQLKKMIAEKEKDSKKG